MRVFRKRNGVGIWINEVAGAASPEIAEHIASLPNRRRGKWTWKPGRLVACSVQSRRRRPQNDGHGLPRNKVLGAAVDADVMAIVVAEAKRRGIAKGALIGRLIETIADDGLFDAVLGAL